MYIVAKLDKYYPDVPSSSTSFTLTILKAIQTWTPPEEEESKGRDPQVPPVIVEISAKDLKQEPELKT